MTLSLIKMTDRHIYLVLTVNLKNRHLQISVRKMYPIPAILNLSINRPTMRRKKSGSPNRNSAVCNKPRIWTQETS